ncbi:MAG TPA: hypothetical protein DD490_03215 [Acidobacteria bacterium]|nr:hypothetical protein [Acidobacteriota bacterium]
MEEGVRPEVMEKAVRAFLADYLRLVEPDATRFLDLDRITLLETSLGRPGVVARVAGTAEGVRVLVLVLIEDNLDEEVCAERITEALTRMGQPHGEPVLASFIGIREGSWVPAGIRLCSGKASHLNGIELLRIYFNTFNLIDCRAEFFLDRPEPLSWAFAALGRPRERTYAEHLAFCRRRLEEADLDDERRELLLRFLE